MDTSGWEVVEQEKCKLIYAKFFDGIQCFDSTLGHLHLATPDFEFNTYDPVLKKLTTKTFSVFPVTPSDLNHIQHPTLLLYVDPEVTGLVVKLTADTYEKTRIIPMFYLQSCNTLAFVGLTICLAVYQEQLVTSVSFETGTLSFISSSVIKYVDADGRVHLYRFKDSGKNIIVFDIPTNFSNTYYFPLAHYVEKLPPEAERAIRHNYRYSKPYRTYDSNIFPCRYTGSSTRYLFNSNIEYITDSNNLWRFRLRIYTENYSIVGNRLILSIILRDSDTGIYRVETYAYDFFVLETIPIDLQSMIQTTESILGAREFTLDLGSAKCRAIVKEYFKPLNQPEEFRETLDIPRYGYPICPNISRYSLEVCDCTGGDVCWDKFILPCETCNPETGEITDTCTAPAHCTLFGCFTDIYATACIENTEHGVGTFPAVLAYFTEPTGVSKQYTNYRLLPNGDIVGYMDLTDTEIFISQPMPWITFFNIYSLVDQRAYEYLDGSVKTVSFMTYVLQEFLNISLEDMPFVWMNGYINIDASFITQLYPDASSLVVYWKTLTAKSWGMHTSQGMPCDYLGVSVHVTHDGEVNKAYSIKNGLLFTYPNITAVSKVPELQAKYDTYCEYAKFFGDEYAYTWGIYKNYIPKTPGTFIFPDTYTV